MSPTAFHEFRIAADRLGHALADGRTLFSDITLGFGRERTGLVGSNGAGKTTLVRILAGELNVLHGTVQRRGTVAYLPQNFELGGDRTLAAILGIDARLAALDRVYAGTPNDGDFDLVGDDGWDLRERAEAELARFGVGHLPLDRPVTGVSGGEGTRVALAGLTLQQPDFLLLDEPTNNLDAAGREALYDLVRGWSGGLLVVSHDRTLLRLLDRIVELTPGGVRVYGGNYDVYDEQKRAEEEAAARELTSAEAALRTARREAQRMRERQQRRESRGKAEALKGGAPKIFLGMQRERSEGTRGRVRETAERIVADGRTRLDAARARVEERGRIALDLPSSELAAGKVVVEMEGVSVLRPGAERPAPADVSLRVVGPERVAIAGPNGSGKTTLLHVIEGTLAPTTGTARLGLAPGDVAFFDQHARRLRPGASVLASYREANPDIGETEARHALARFLFEGDAVHQPTETLSGGQRLRAALACTLNGWHPPRLLLLDEPTNHLDLDSLAALEDVLSGYDGALIVVSHDRAFLNAIGVERVIEVG